MSEKQKEKMSIVAFGCGNMASAVLNGLWEGLNDSGHPGHWTLYTPSQTRALILADKFHGSCLKNLETIPNADIYILGMKPQQLESFAKEVEGKIPSGALVISMLAGVEIELLQRRLSHQKIMRVMPNTPCKLGLGVLPFYAAANVLDHDIHWPILNQAFMSFNKVVECRQESDLNLLTPYSGSGPAYFYEFVQVLADDLSSRGIDPQLARDVLIQTCLGAATMMSSESDSPQVLRDRVTSKAGVTAAALEVLQRPEGGLSDLISQSLDAALKRNAELNQ